MAYFWFLYNNSDGSMYTHYRGNSEEWTNIPDGCSAIRFDDTDPTAQDAYRHSSIYGVVDGKLQVNVSDSELLAYKQRLKNIELDCAYELVVNSGFQVTIGANTYNLGWTDKDKLNLQLTNTSIDKGDQVFPIYYTDINGTPFQLTQQSDLNTIESTATRFYVNQHQQIQSLKYTVSQATLETIDSITWTNAEY